MKKAVNVGRTLKILRYIEYMKERYITNPMELSVNSFGEITVLANEAIDVLSCVEILYYFNEKYRYVINISQTGNLVFAILPEENAVLCVFSQTVHKEQNSTKIIQCSNNAVTVIGTGYCDICNIPNQTLGFNILMSMTIARTKACIDRNNSLNDTPLQNAFNCDCCNFEEIIDNYMHFAILSDKYQNDIRNEMYYQYAYLGNYYGDTEDGEFFKLCKYYMDKARDCPDLFGAKTTFTNYELAEKLSEERVDESEETGDILYCVKETDEDINNV